MRILVRIIWAEDVGFPTKSIWSESKWVEIKIKYDQMDTKCHKDTTIPWLQQSESYSSYENPWKGHLL